MSPTFDKRKLEMDEDWTEEEIEEGFDEISGYYDVEDNEGEME